MLSSTLRPVHMFKTPTWTYNLFCAAAPKQVFTESFQQNSHVSINGFAEKWCEAMPVEQIWMCLCFVEILLFVHTGVRVHRWARLRTQTGMMSACTEKQGLSAQGAPATPLCTLSALCGCSRSAHSVDLQVPWMDEVYLHRVRTGHTICTLCAYGSTWW